MRNKCVFVWEGECVFGRVREESYEKITARANVKQMVSKGLIRLAGLEAGSVGVLKRVHQRRE